MVEFLLLVTGQTHNTPKQHIHHPPCKIGVHQLPGSGCLILFHLSLLFSFLVLGSVFAYSLLLNVSTESNTTAYCHYSEYSGNLCSKETCWFRGLGSLVFALSHWLSIHLANIWWHHHLLLMLHVSEVNCPMSVQVTPSFTSTALPFCSAKDLPESDPGILFSRSFIVLALPCTSLETGPW